MGLVLREYTQPSKIEKQKTFKVDPSARPCCAVVTSWWASYIVSINKLTLPSLDRKVKGPVNAWFPVKFIDFPFSVWITLEGVGCKANQRKETKMVEKILKKSKKRWEFFVPAHHFLLFTLYIFFAFWFPFFNFLVADHKEAAKWTAMKSWVDWVRVPMEWCTNAETVKLGH